MTDIRILVTGSRDWQDRQVVASAISGWLREQGTSIGSAWPFPVVVTGAAAGADDCAAAVAENWGWTPEQHRADWYGPCASECPKGHRRSSARNGRTYCPDAAKRRNQRMVDLGADICLAFPLPDSRGTWDCVRRCEKAGIPVRVFEQTGAVA